MKQQVNGGVAKCQSCGSLTLPVSLAGIQGSEHKDGEKRTGFNVYLLCIVWLKKNELHCCVAAVQCSQH